MNGFCGCSFCGAVTTKSSAELFWVVMSGATWMCGECSDERFPGAPLRLRQIRAEFKAARDRKDMAAMSYANAAHGLLCGGLCTEDRGQALRRFDASTVCLEAARELLWGGDGRTAVANVN